MSFANLRKNKDVIKKFLFWTILFGSRFFVVRELYTLSKKFLSVVEIKKVFFAKFTPQLGHLTIYFLIIHHLPLRLQEQICNQESSLAFCLSFQ